MPGGKEHKVLLNRIRDRIEEKTKESHYGSRAGWDTVDAIFLVRQIIEKAKEVKIALHFNFVNFKTAFDTIMFVINCHITRLVWM